MMLTYEMTQPVGGEGSWFKGQLNQKLEGMLVAGEVPGYLQSPAEVCLSKPGLGVVETPWSCLLEILDSVQRFADYPKQDSIVVVHTAVDEGMDEGLSDSPGGPG